MGWLEQLGLSPAMLAVLGGVGAVVIVVGLVIGVVLLLIPLCLVFKKMKNQWYEALIGWHNGYVLITNAGKPGRWIFVVLLWAWLVSIAASLRLARLTTTLEWDLPRAYMSWENILLLVGFILVLYVYFSVCIWLAKKFGRTAWFGVGLAILPWIFLPILGYGNAVYKK